jgi:hypothetical protein
MKTIILLLSIISLTFPIKAQETNGWEFLFWKMNKDSVEKVLIENKSKMSDATALDAQFNYQGMNTWLYYDSQKKLNQVHQRETFSVIQNKEAADFFYGLKASFISKYGEPDEYNEDKKDSVVTMTWDLKYTKITLEYDYRYKIIDEFGAGSYWVDVIFVPAKAE